MKRRETHNPARLLGNSVAAAGAATTVHARRRRDRVVPLLQVLRSQTALFHRRAVSERQKSSESRPLSSPPSPTLRKAALRNP